MAGNKSYGSGDVTAAYLRRANERVGFSNGTNALEVYRRLIRESGQLKTGAQATALPSAQTRTGKSQTSVGGRIAATLLDATGQVDEGLLRGIEGAVDFTLGLIMMPQIIGNKIGSAVVGRNGTWDDAIKEIMEYDVTSGITGAVRKGVEAVTGLDLVNDSYQNEGWGQYAREIEQGIGNMLPAVAVSIATAGAGAPAAVAELASLGTLGMEAAGQSAQESFTEGAGYGQGMAYGALSGGIEIASEKLFGGVNKLIAGTGFLDDVVPSVAKKGAARIAANFVEEGAEEVVSDLLNPLAKTVYKGKDALKEYGTEEYWKDMGKSFLIGGATATVYSGTVGYGLSRVGYGHVGKEADVESLLEDIDGLARKERNARESGKLTDELSERIRREAVSRYADIQDVLTSRGMKEGQRAKIIQEFSLSKAFDADGRMSRSFGEEIGFYPKAASTTHKGKDEIAATTVPLHAQYYAGRRANVDEALRETGMTPVQSLTSAEKEGYRSFLRVERTLESLIGAESPFAGDRLSFAIVEPDADSRRAAEGAYVRGQRTILLSREALANPSAAAQKLHDSWFGILIEESLHMVNDTPGLTVVQDAEGQLTYTSRYMELKELLWDGKYSVIKGLIEDGYFQDFGKNESEIKKTIDRLLNKKVDRMSNTELQQRDELLDEVIAHLGRDELSTKHFYERLVRADPTATERILDGIRTIKEKMSRKNTASETVAAELSERAQRAENLFLEAMTEAGVQVDTDGIRLNGDRREEQEESDSAGSEAIRVRYSRTLSGSFESVVDKVIRMTDEEALHNKEEGNFISVAEHTPRVILDHVQGAEDLKIIMRFDALYLASRKSGALDGHYHDLGSIAKQLPELISNPDAIVRMDNGRLNVITEMRTEKGNNGLVSIELNTVKTVDRNKSMYNLIVSAFSAKNGYVRNTFQNHGVTVEYTKGDLPQSNPQLYEWLAIINEKSPGDSVAQDRSNVNPSNEKKSTVRYSRSRLETVADEYGIHAINDYVGVQKRVIQTLSEQGFFENGNNVVYNENTGYEIEIGKKGIEETFGPGKRYQTLTSEIKRLKLATLQDLPTILRNAHIVEQNVKNIHNESSPILFDYLEGAVDLDGKRYRVLIDVKKSTQKNKFWMHRVQIENGTPTATRPEGNNVLLRGSTATDSVAQKQSDVNPSDEKNMRTARKRAENANSRAFEDAVKRMEERERREAPVEFKAAKEGRKSDWQTYADLTQQKAFSRKDAKKMLEHIQNTLEYCFAEGYRQEGASRVIIKTTNRVFNQATDALWQKLNTVQTETERRAVFRELAEHILDETRVKVLLDDELLQRQGEILDTLRTYTHKLALDTIQEKIQAQFGKDGMKNINRVWQVPKGTSGLSVEKAAAGFTEITGVQIDADQPADILAELELLRRQSMEAIESQTRVALADGISNEERSSVLNAVVEGLEYEWKKSGTKSAKARMEEAIRAGVSAERDSRERVAIMQTQMDRQAKQQAKQLEAERQNMQDMLDRQKRKAGRHEEFLRKYVAQEKERLAKNRMDLRDNQLLTRRLNTVQYKADRIKTWKSGEFRAASEPGNADFLTALSSLAATNQRGNFSATSARKALAKVADWYEQPSVQFLLGATFDGGGHVVEGGMWRQEMLDKMRRLADGENGTESSRARTQFTAEDAADLIDILDHARKIVEDAYYVRVQGKRVKAQEAAKRYADLLATQGNALRNTMFGRVIDRYRIEFYDPASLMRWFDGYAEHGFLQDMHAAFRQAEFDTDVIRTDMMQQLAKFEEEHKGYFTKASRRTITVNGDEIPLMSGLYLALALERDQAIQHLMRSGFRYADSHGNEKRVNAFMPSANAETTMEEMRARAGEIRANILDQCRAEDRSFAELARKLFNEDCKEYKRQTDLERFGYTNVLEGPYIPIRIADKAIRVDTADYRTEIDRATNAAFNKNTNEHAANAIIAGDLLDVLTRHIDGIARYAGLSEAIRTYETLLNINTESTPESYANSNRTTNSVRRVLETVWPDRGSTKGATSYLNDMVSDIQHISPVRRGTSIAQILEKIRGHAAVAVLGANPKVLATQFSSLFAAASVLDARYITQGMTMKANRTDIEAYCKLAYLRRIGNDSVRAQGVVDQISKVGEFCTSLIGKMDSYVVDRLWNASLLQAAAQSHVDIDSETCKKAAGEILTSVIYETQQNAQMTERSYAMRSGNFIDKVVTMFSADSMKIVGRVLDAAGAYKVAKQGGQAVSQRSAAKQYRRAVGALASQAVYMAVVATLFRKLLAYDDDDTLGNWSVGDIRSFLEDVVSSAIGGLPIIKECFEFFQTGYDIEDMGVGALNDLLSAVRNVVELPKEALTGKLTGEKAATRVRSLFYSLGQITGIPIRNVYKYARGILNIVDDVSGSHMVYRTDHFFDVGSLSADLADAIEAGDDEKAAFVAGLALDERVDLAKNSLLRRELIRLNSNGASVLPRTVGSKVTWNGETYRLTARQKKRFEAVYHEVSVAAERLIQSSYYAAVTDTVKAKAIARLYEIYYNLAIEDFLGVESETKAVLFSKAIPPEKLTIVVAAASEIHADTDAGGQAIPGSKRQKIASLVSSLRLSAAQKYMIFAYLGYSARAGFETVKKYVRSLNLKQGEMEQLLQWCGYSD